MAAFDASPMGFSGEAVDFGFGSYVLPPASRVAAYVCSSKPDQSPQHIERKRVPTLAAALTKVRTSRQDWIVCLPGHTESGLSATYLDAIVAGTQIVGYGHGSLQPTLRWTAATDTLAIAVANVQVRGMYFKMEGANGVTKAINVTGADCWFDRCRFEVASGATAKSAIALEIGTGAHRCKITRSHFWGTATHNVTDGIKVVAAVTDLLIQDNWMDFSATAGNGNVHFTAAALRFLIRNNVMYNTHTASTANIAVDDDTAADGMIIGNHLGQKNDGTITAQGVVFGGTEALCVLSQTYAVDQPMKNSTLSPAAGT